MRTLSLVLSLVGLLATASVASAERYQAQVDARYTEREHREGMLGVRGEFHFVPVHPRRHPLAEAAYLERSSHLYASAEDGIDRARIGGALYIPDTFYYAAAQLTRTDQNGDSDTGAEATLGLLPIDGLRVTTTVTDDGYDPNLSAKYVAQLIGADTVNLEASLVDADGGAVVRLAGDYYLDRRWSLGAQVVDRDGANAVTLRTTKFFSPRLGVSAAFTDAEQGNRFTIGGLYRF